MNSYNICYHLWLKDDKEKTIIINIKLIIIDQIIQLLSDKNRIKVSTIQETETVYITINHYVHFSNS